jgi:DNA polymerase III subunit gamma/tau
MAYQVIARKWRPKNFDFMVGQNHISQTLLNSLRSGRIPHALLFTGPRGTGKTTTARILAKSLRCPNAKDFVPCDACSECEDIAASRANNVIEIDGASNNGVDAIRELRDSVAYMPSSGKFKIYIIDEVHMLSGSAFNALLKTLEEPPEHVVFIMATTEVQKIPNTILSRCQRYDFRRISTRLIANHLTQICEAEKIKAEAEALWAIARQGDGSMRDSQSLLDQVISFADGELTLAKVTEVLGLTDRGLIVDTIAALTERDAKKITRIIERLFTSGYDPVNFMRDLLEEVRHLLLAKMASEQADNLIDLSADEVEHLRRLGAGLSEEDVHLLFDMALKGAQDLHRAQDPRVVLEMVLLRMSIAPRLGHFERSTPVVMPKNLKSSDKAPISTMPPTPVEAKHEASGGPWPVLVEKIKKVNSVMAAKLEHLHVVQMNNGELVLGVPEKYKFLFAQVNDDGFKKKLSNYTSTFLGNAHTITVKELGSTSAVPAASLSQLTQKKSDEEQRQLETDVENHPLVKSAKKLFNTQITSIRARK